MEEAPMTKAEHLGEWKPLWDKVLKVYQQTHTRWDRYKREAFELLRAVVVYQRNAIEAFTEDTLHEVIRPPGGTTTATDLHRYHDPLFSLIPLPNLDLGRFYLASASFRLPVGVAKAVEADAGPFETLGLFKKDFDWHRPEFQKHFPTVKELGCCKVPSLGATSDEKLRNAIVAILVHRDDFGHGEVGHAIKDGGAYRRERESVLNQLYVCRILQAQRVLVNWSLDRL